MSSSSVPHLVAVTRPLHERPDLLSLADSVDPLVWMRGDRGCVGIGEAVRLEFSGAERFSEASRAWRAISSQATIDDAVGMPGTGLVAFGTFAFADESAATSVLIVPRIIVAQHRDTWWITTVSAAGTPPSSGALPVPLPAPQPPGRWSGVVFDDLDGKESRSVQEFHRSIAAAADRIARGDAEKIVVSRQITASLPEEADLRVPIRRLAERYLDCWTFAVGGFVGASPETLVRTERGRVSARVLAGTRGRHRGAADDAKARDELVTSAKEQHEHAFAVQSVVTALAPHIRDLRTSEEPFALELPNVWHLATDLGAVLEESSTSLELAAALHPTAAVAGTPTSTAIAAIGEIEPFDRGRYSGAVGWIDARGDGEWVIGLRCAQVSAPRSEGGRTVTASAGGGIVDGSDPSGELRETVSKFRPITEACAR